MIDAIDLFIEEARVVTVTGAAKMLGIQHRDAVYVGDDNRNYAGPCPSCGGKDRFSINVRMQAFNCRQCGGKGRDGISLMALANHHNLHQRKGLLGACADVLGREVPDADQRETDKDRQDRLDRIAERKRQNEEQAQAAGDQQNAFREREVRKARGIWLQSPERPDALLGEYLYRRTGYRMHEAVFANLRLAPNCTYWHGRDNRGFEIAFYSGPAMVAPFVNVEGAITGCHQTWIDIRNPPKFRAKLLDADGSPLPAKKMRGVKRGSFIPLFGLMTSARWVGGEGIENGLSIAGAEGFRADTFYFAAGDLGNLCGPADPKSSFAHPHETMQDRRGRIRAVRVQGPVPKQDQAPDEAMRIPDHVDHLVMLADGDSEPIMTAAAMARAEARFDRQDREIEIWWAPVGQDFSELMASGA